MTEAISAKEAILAAANTALVDVGYAGLSTRRIAASASVPLSQIHYHFGSRQGLVLALLEQENQRLLARQASMYESDMPLWKQWEQAVDYLEDDLASGYIRLLQEMTAAGWSDPEVAEAVRGVLSAWFELLKDTAARASKRIGGLGPFTAAEVGALIGTTFLGIESMILLGFGESDLPSRSALRKIGAMLRSMEEA